MNSYIQKYSSFVEYFIFFPLCFGDISNGSVSRWTLANQLPSSLNQRTSNPISNTLKLTRFQSNIPIQCQINFFLSQSYWPSPFPTTSMALATSQIGKGLDLFFSSKTLLLSKKPLFLSDKALVLSDKAQVLSDKVPKLCSKAPSFNSLTMLLFLLLLPS